MTYVEEAAVSLQGGPVKSLDVSGDLAVAGGDGGLVHLASLGSSPRIAAEVRVPALVNSVRFSPDGGRVAIGSRDHVVRVWEPATNELRVIGGHDNWVMTVAWNDDGDELVTGSEDGTIRIWDATGGERRRIDLGYPANAVDRRGDLIAVANGNRKLYLVDASTGEVTREVRGAQQLLWSVAISPGGRRVAWTGRDRAIRVLDLEADRKVLTIPAHRAQAWSAVWDESGERLVSASADGTAAIWSVDGSPIERVPAPGWVRAARLAGDRLVLTGEDGRLRVYRNDGNRAMIPDAVTIPRPPRACAHWDPLVGSSPKRVCDGGCGSMESLRLCVTCGHVGCCESQWAHATKHWEATGHPNTVPTPPGAFDWKWCYADDAYVKRIAKPGGDRVA